MFLLNTDLWSGLAERRRATVTSVRMVIKSNNRIWVRVLGVHMQQTSHPQMYTHGHARTHHTCYWGRASFSIYEGVRFLFGLAPNIKSFAPCACLMCLAKSAILCMAKRPACPTLFQYKSVHTSWCHTMAI